MGFFSSLFSQADSEEKQQQKADRKNFDILKYDGIRAQRMGKTEYAAKCFTEALKIQKDFETTQYLVSACFMLNRHDQALEALNEWVATGEEPANVLLMRAGLLFAMGRYAEAAADCGQAIQLEPDNYIAYFQLAKTQRALGEPSQAIRSIDSAIAIKADFSDAYAMRADLHLAMEKGNDALTDVGKLIELTPEDETAYLLRGRIHELLGDTAAAFADYRQASDMNPFNEEAYLVTGRLMMKQGKYDEAIALFNEAIEDNETSAKVYAARAMAKRQTGDHEGALADEEKANELNPDGKEKTAGNHNFDDLYKGNIL